MITIILFTLDYYYYFIIPGPYFLYLTSLAFCCYCCNGIYREEFSAGVFYKRQANKISFDVKRCSFSLFPIWLSANKYKGLGKVSGVKRSQGGTTLEH